MWVRPIKSSKEGDMKMKQKLLLKYLNGSCSKKQEAKIQSWLAEDIAHSQELAQLKKVWAEFDDLNSFRTPKVKKEWKTMKSLIGIHGVKLTVSEIDTQGVAPSILKENDVVTKGEKASNPVVLAPKPIVQESVKKSTPIESTKALEAQALASRAMSGKMEENAPSVPIAPIAKPVTDNKLNEDGGIPLIEKVIYSVVGILAAGIIAFGIFKLATRKSPIIESVTTEHSQEFTLPDGSLVILDPYSTLTYSREMEDNRRISLLGGGSFDVVADTEPMIVDYGDVSIMSRGTLFDLEDNEDFVSVESLKGMVRFFETSNINNGTDVNEGEKMKYSNGEFEYLSIPEEVIEEAPLMTQGEVIRLDRLLDWLMEESDWKVVSSSSMPIDNDHEITVNLEQSYDQVLSMLGDIIDIEYEAADCTGCYLIKKMKAY